MKISVCIPSYKRPIVKTLAWIPYAKVYVDRKEVDEYKQTNEGAQIIACDDGVQGNVSRVRNYILNREFEQGADAVCLMDDDLKGIYCYNVNEETGFGYEPELIEGEQFLEFAEKWATCCSEWGFKLWGVNVNYDPLGYRHSNPFSTTSMVLGPFCCHLKNDIRYDERLFLKEDYDLAIQHLNKNRGVLRLNFAHYVCEQGTNKGGVQAQRNIAREREQFELLQRKWGSDIVKQDKAKRAGTQKVKVFDYNPIIHVPIKGV